MKLLVDLRAGRKHCEACPLTECGDAQYSECALFMEPIRTPQRYEPIRCPACIAAEKALDELVEARAQEIVRLAFERSREGME